MTRRYIGDAVIYLEYVGERAGRSEYRGKIVVGKHVWPFAELQSGMGGFPYASDDPRAFDRMAEMAAGFGSYYTTHNRCEDDLPEWAPSAEVADAIEEATAWARCEDNSCEVRRSPEGRPYKVAS